MTALQMFEAYMNKVTSSPEMAAWCKSHATECKNFKTYASAVIMGKTPVPPKPRSPFGQSLVMVAQLAIAQEKLGAGFGISEFGVGAFGDLR